MAFRTKQSPQKASRASVDRMDKLAKLPWAEWEMEYLGDKTEEGTWTYPTLNAFARAKGLDNHDVHKVCGSYRRTGWPYYGDWNEKRTGHRWKGEVTKLQTISTKLDARMIALQESVNKLEDLKREERLIQSIWCEFEEYMNGRIFLQNHRMATDPRRRNEKAEALQVDRVKMAFGILRKYQQALDSAHRRRIDYIAATKEQAEQQQILPALPGDVKEERAGFQVWFERMAKSMHQTDEDFGEFRLERHLKPPLVLEAQVVGKNGGNGDKK